MMHAYDKNYLEKAMIALGRMLDYAVYDLKYDLQEFWDKFLLSPVSSAIEVGTAKYTVGMSGVELALEVLDINEEIPEPAFTENRSEEYWIGWVLAYYQWLTALPFEKITFLVPIEEIRGMYYPYHEMDITQFCDHLDALMAERQMETNLKRIRLAVGLSQSQLAELTDIPVRTIQQYEQGQKNINHARADYILQLSRALYCEPSMLMERPLYANHRKED